MISRIAPLLVALLLVVALTPAAAEQAVPPVSMTCPMHPDVVESTPGDCPLCNMKLVPVRLESTTSTSSHRIQAPVAPSAAVASAAPAPSVPPPNELSAGPGLGAAPGPTPETVTEMLEQLNTRKAEVGEFVERGAFGAVWVPAFQARDLAIALEAHLGELSQAGRDAAEPAIQRLVRTAWLLDAFGDLGNRQQIVEAYAIFTSAVGDVVAAYTMKP